VDGCVDPHGRNGLAVPIEFGIEIPFSKRPARAVSDPGLIDAHGHVAAFGELMQDSAVRLRSTQRFIERPWSHSFDQKENRMSACGAGSCDDRADARSAADHVMVENIEVVATIARALPQGHWKDDPLAVAHESDLNPLRGRHRGDRCERLLDTTNGCAIYREENITWSDAPIGSRRVGNDGFDQNARVSHQLLACSDIGLRRRQAHPELAFARPVSIRRSGGRALPDYKRAG